MTIKPEGGGGKALVAQPLREELFLRLPLQCRWILKIIRRKK